MNGNFKYTISDPERSKLQRYLTGRAAPATRKQLVEFLEGCLAAALGEPEVAASGRQHLTLTQHQTAEVRRLEKEGKCESYIRGWLQVARSK